MKLIESAKRLFKKQKAVKIDLEFPNSWESMSPSDFKEVCKVLSIQNIGRDRALFLCLCALTGIRPDDPSKYKDLKKGLSPYIYNGQAYFMNAATIAEACHDLSFIYDSVGLPPSPFEFIDRKLYGIPFETFYEVDSLILRAAAEKNDGYLKEAVKSLTGGRVRKLIPAQRVAVTIWWNGVKEFLANKYPYVLKKGDSITDKTQAEILQDLLSCLNDDRPQENGKILKTDVHSVLHALNNKYEHAVKGVSK